MAWNIHWQCCFQSFGGTQYAVNIYEQNYTGSIVQLTGAAEPFVTQEDDNDDIFTPIRVQTGYLRVIDMDGTLLEELTPNGSTERLVRLVRGTYSNGTFTAGSTSADTLWQGFLQPVSYTQKWVSQPHEVEIPVQSFLGALRDVEFSPATLGSSSLGQLILDGFAAILGTTTPYYSICFVGSIAPTTWLPLTVDTTCFVAVEEYYNDNLVEELVTGWNWGDVLSSILRLFGLTAREGVNMLVIGHYDDPYPAGALKYGSVPWYTFNSYVRGYQTGLSWSGSRLYSTPLLSEVSFRGDDGSETCLSGSPRVSVILSIPSQQNIITLPPVEVLGSPVQQLTTQQGTLYVQPQSPSSTRELFYYYYYSKHNLQGSTTYAGLLPNTIINGKSYNPYAIDGVYHYTGAFPCRFSLASSSDNPVLKSGIYINTQYRTQSQTTTITSQRCYQVTSLLGFEANEGWLHIDFTWLDVVYSGGSWYTQNTFTPDGSIWTQLYVHVQVGDLYYNYQNNSWSGSYNMQHALLINILDGTIQSNKETMAPASDVDGGFFIPINRHLSGKVTLHILNASPVQDKSTSSYLYGYTHILSDLTVRHVLPQSITRSGRDNNRYSTATSCVGSTDKEIKLDIGTYNNNRLTPSFIKDASGNIVELLSFYTSQNTTTTMRPEKHLLQRLKLHLCTCRRTFTATIAALGIDPYTLRYAYSGRTYWAVTAERHWRDDTIRMKFLEVPT